MAHRHCVHCIIPPHVLKNILDKGNPALRKAALSTLLMTERLRGKRAVRSLIALPQAPSNGSRAIYDLRGGVSVGAAQLVRSEGSKPSQDASVNQAFDFFGTTRDFYLKVFNRNSTDGKGAPLNGYVHYGSQYDNAFWDGQEMIFGDGDGQMFTDLTKSVDVIAHELTHGVTENTAALEYHGQSGALNESMSDVMGSLVKQWSLGQTADKADWLIGAEVWTPGIGGDALRSLKAPGTAYDNDVAGKDPQPGHMRDYQNLPDTDDGDYGGVHINSGIPNKAFYLAATAIGGNAWEAPGQIWYESLLASGQTTQFQDFADVTFIRAGHRYGTGSKEQTAVKNAWDGVGIRVSSAAVGAIAPVGATVVELSAKIDGLSRQVAALSDNMRGKS